MGALTAPHQWHRCAVEELPQHQQQTSPIPSIIEGSPTSKKRHKIVSHQVNEGSECQQREREPHKQGDDSLDISDTSDISNSRSKFSACLRAAASSRVVEVGLSARVETMLESAALSPQGFPSNLLTSRHRNPRLASKCRTKPRGAPRSPAL